MNINNSISNVEEWDQSKSYNKNSIVKILDTNDEIEGYTNVSYYYSLKNVTANSESPSTKKDLWGGYFTQGNQGNQKKPEFLWKPSYNSSVNHTPSIHISKFGEGYEQRFRKGIFNDYIEINITFEHRDTQEARCINHFLKQRQGVEAFYFKHIPELHQDTGDDNYRKLFICEKWTSNFEFFNNHSITAMFRQVNT